MCCRHRSSPIDAVVSTMTTTLNGPFDAPLMAAVEWAEIFIVLKPNRLAKYNGTYAWVSTATAFAAVPSRESSARDSLVLQGCQALQFRIPSQHCNVCRLGYDILISGCRDRAVQISGGGTVLVVAPA